MLLFRPASANGDNQAAREASLPNHAALGFHVTDTEMPMTEGSELRIDAEYEWRLPFAHGAVGVGPTLEIALGDHTAMSSVGLVYLHPWHGLKLFAGGGVEHDHGGNHALWRGGVAYDLHVYGGSCLTPIGTVDRVDHHTALVAGLAVGYTF